MGICIACAFLLMGLITYLRTKKIEAPYTLVCIVWGVYLLVYQVMGDVYYPIGTRFYYSILLWVCGFYVCSIFSCQFTSRSCLTNRPDTTIIKAYYVVTPIFAIIISIIWIKAALTSSNIFLYLRMMSTGLDSNISAPNIGIFAYFTSLILVLFLIELASYGLKRKKVICILFILNLLLAFITMSKTVLFSTVVAAIFVIMFKKGISIRFILPTLIALVGGFVLMQALRSEDGSINVSFIGSYFIPPSVAFEYANMDEVSPVGSYVFRLLYAVGSSLGISSDGPVDVIMEYTSVGNNRITNTYTVLYPFYHDFGFIGVFIFGCFTGVIGGFFYKKALNSIPARVFYSIFGATIVFQLIGEVLYTNASMYLQYLVYAYLPYKIRITHGSNSNGYLQWGKIHSRSN